MTTQEQLDELQAAKTRILTTGQAYTADGLQMTRANLSDITAEIARLERKLAQEARAGFSGGGLGYGVPSSS
jgi:hypothetical protein